MPSGIYKRLVGKPGQERPNMVGQRFNRWLVISYNKSVSNQKEYDYYSCHCDCGTQRVVKGVNLRNGNSRSCGCLQRETISKIGKQLNKYDQTNENNPNYSTGFSSRAMKTLQETIRQRSNYMCQHCGKTQKENGRKLDVHHIDDNHYNDDSKNLAALCRACHTLTNIGAK